MCFECQINMWKLSGFKFQLKSFKKSERGEYILKALEVDE